MSKELTIEFSCDPAELPAVVRRVLAGMPDNVAAEYLGRGEADVVFTQPQLVGAFILGRLAVGGRLSGPAPLIESARFFALRLEGTLRRVAQLGDRPPRAAQKVQRQLVAMTRDEAGLVSLPAGFGTLSRASRTLRQ